jgi:anti-sigma factor RsiW
MTDEQQLKVQAFLDGELPEREARDVAALLARDSEANALLTELRHTRQAFKDSEPAVKLPESREFYWSKIEREIARLEPEAAPARSPSVFTLLRRILIPLAATAALVMAALWGGVQTGLLGGGSPESAAEMTSADSDAFTYHDYANGTTLVWFSYPAER